MKRRTAGIILGRAALLAALVALWEILPLAGLVDPELLPPFSRVAAMLWQLLGRTDIQADLLLTAAEVGVAFLLSIPLGALLGFISAESRFWGQVLDPLLFFLFGIPKSIFLPMFILAVGIGFWEKAAFGIFSTFLIVVLNTAAAVRSVNPDHLLTARACGARPMQIITRVYLPSMLPVLLEGLRLAIVFTFTAIVLAEMYASSQGIGHEIANWGENFQMRRLLAGVVLLSAIAIALNETIRMAERRFSAWRN
jgi:NitT/TauT family transport system permease protein